MYKIFSFEYSDWWKTSGFCSIIVFSFSCGNRKAVDGKHLALLPCNIFCCAPESRYELLTEYYTVHSQCMSSQHRSKSGGKEVTLNRHRCICCI